MVAQESHKLQVGGSIPPPAIGEIDGFLLGVTEKSLWLLTGYCIRLEVVLAISLGN